MFRRISHGAIAALVLPSLLWGEITESLVNGSFEDGLNGWAIQRSSAVNNLYHDPPVQQCVCFNAPFPHAHTPLTAFDGQHFCGLTYIRNSTPNASGNVNFRQAIKVRNWDANADRTRYDLEVWAQMSHGGSSIDGFIEQDYFLYCWNDGQVPANLFAAADRRIRLGRYDAMPWMKGSARNWNGWKPIKLSGSMLGNPQYVVLEVRLTHGGGPPTLHNCFDDIRFSAESATGSNIGPFAGDIPNSDFEVPPYNEIHWYHDPHPPTGWELFHDFERNNLVPVRGRGPIEAYTNGVTSPTDPLGTTTPSGEHFWGRVLTVGDPNRGANCQGNWGHLLPVRNWSPDATGFRWRMHYLTKLWDSNDTAVEWFELCWDTPGSGHSIFDPPEPNEYQATMVTDARWFAWLRFIEINDRSFPGASESSPFVEIEQTGEFASTNADGSAGCPEYVLLRARTNAGGGDPTLKDMPYKILYDKLDFYVEAIGGCNSPRTDLDGDGDVDQSDFGVMQRCLTWSAGGVLEGCHCANFNDDETVNGQDLTIFENCARGPTIQADEDCQ